MHVNYVMHVAVTVTIKLASKYVHTHTESKVNNVNENIYKLN